MGYRGVENTFSRIATGIIMLMMFLTTADVAGRYLFNSPVIGAYEISSMMLVGVVFLGLAYVQSKKGHVKVEAATFWMPKRVQIALDIFGGLVGLVIMGLLTWRSGIVFWEAWVLQDYSMGLIHIPLWPGKLMVPLGTGLLCLRLVSDIVESCAQLAQDSKEHRQ